MSRLAFFKDLKTLLSRLPAHGGVLVAVQDGHLHGNGTLSLGAAYSSPNQAVQHQALQMQPTLHVDMGQANRS